MIYKVFAIKDRALDTFSAPFTQATIESGLRMWREMVMFQEESNRYRRSPEDYSLYCVGTYNDETARMESEMPARISSATEILAESLKDMTDVT